MGVDGRPEYVIGACEKAFNDWGSMKLICISNTGSTKIAY